MENYKSAVTDSGSEIKICENKRQFQSRLLQATFSKTNKRVGKRIRRKNYSVLKHDLAELLLKVSCPEKYQELSANPYIKVLRQAPWKPSHRLSNHDRSPLQNQFWTIGSRWYKRCSTIIASLQLFKNSTSAFELGLFWKLISFLIRNFLFNITHRTFCLFDIFISKQCPIIKRIVFVSSISTLFYQLLQSRIAFFAQNQAILKRPKLSLTSTTATILLLSDIFKRSLAF